LQMHKPSNCPASPGGWNTAFKQDRHGKHEEDAQLAAQLKTEKLLHHWVRVLSAQTLHAYWCGTRVNRLTMNKYRF
jgi:hypothetical protein